MLDIIESLRQSPIVLLAVMLICGIVAGRVLMLVRLPAITGYILSGLILGPEATDLISKGMLHPLQDFTEVALGIIAFNIGTSFDRATVRSLGPGIVLTTLGQSLAVFVMTTTLVWLLGMPIVYALLCGALAISTGPTTTYLLLRSFRIEGRFASYVYGNVAFSDVLCIISFGILSSATIHGVGTEAANLSKTLLISVRSEALSCIVGAVLGLIILLPLQLVQKDLRLGEGHQETLFFGALLAAIGISVALKLSTLLTPMCTGVVLSNGIEKVKLDQLKALIEPLTTPLFVVFLVTAGARLQPDALMHPSTAFIAVAYVLTSVAGKVLGTFGAAGVLGLQPPIRKYLGFSVAVQGGLVIGLAVDLLHKAMLTFPESAMGPMHRMISALLVGVLIYQLIGPSIVRFGMTRGAASN